MKNFSHQVSQAYTQRYNIQNRQLIFNFVKIRSILSIKKIMYLYGNQNVILMKFYIIFSKDFIISSVPSQTQFAFNYITNVHFITLFRHFYLHFIIFIFTFILHIGFLFAFSLWQKRYIF